MLLESRLRLIVVCTLSLCVSSLRWFHQFEPFPERQTEIEKLIWCIDWFERIASFERIIKFWVFNILKKENKMAELSDVMMSLQRFSWPDYLVLVLMLFLCILIGIYFGVSQKSNSENEYLMGGRTMSIFPVSMSLVARYNIQHCNNWISVKQQIFLFLSFISGITLLGLPTEIYSFGIQYLYVIGGVIAMGLVMGYVFLPVFHDLNITSTYEVKDLHSIFSYLFLYLNFYFPSSQLSRVCPFVILGTHIVGHDPNLKAPFCLRWMKVTKSFFMNGSMCEINQKRRST